MTIVTIGIDLAKNVFEVHGVSAGGKAELVRVYLMLLGFSALPYIVLAYS